MVSSSLKRCSTTSITAAKKMLNSNGDSTHPCRNPYTCPGQHLPQQFSVDRVVGLLKIDGAHAQRDFLCRRTTNSMSMVDRAGRKPHCSSGSIFCASRKSLRRSATIFISTLPAWETSEIPRKFCFSHLDCCVFPLLWDFLPSPHADENGMEMPEDDGLTGGWGRPV